MDQFFISHRLQNRDFLVLIISVFCTLLLLGGCSSLDFDSGNVDYTYPEEDPVTGYYEPPSITKRNKERKLFGPDGINIGGNINTGKQQTGAAIGVNSFLWRASLSAVSSVPLESADPFGGVILTEWYSPIDNPQERFKVTIYILDQQLRADAVEVTVFREQKSQQGEWLRAPTNPDTASKLEDLILTKARALRVRDLG